MTAEIEYTQGRMRHPWVGVEVDIFLAHRKSDGMTIYSMGKNQHGILMYFYKHKEIFLNFNGQAIQTKKKKPTFYVYEFLSENEASKKITSEQVTSIQKDIVDTLSDWDLFRKLASFPQACVPSFEFLSASSRYRS